MMPKTRKLQGLRRRTEEMEVSSGEDMEELKEA